MANQKPIQVGTSKRLEELYAAKKSGLPVKPAKKNARETSPGQFDDKSLKHANTLGVSNKKYQ